MKTIPGVTVTQIIFPSIERWKWLRHLPFLQSPSRESFLLRSFVTSFANCRPDFSVYLPLSQNCVFYAQSLAATSSFLFWFLSFWLSFTQPLSFALSLIHSHPCFLPLKFLAFFHYSRQLKNSPLRLPLQSSLLLCFPSQGWSSLLGSPDFPSSPRSLFFP